jgi:hypothetical protein
MLETRRKTGFEVAFVMTVMMMVPSVATPSFAHVLTFTAVNTRAPPTIKTRMHVSLQLPERSGGIARGQSASRGRERPERARALKLGLLRNDVKARAARLLSANARAGGMRGVVRSRRGAGTSTGRARHGRPSVAQIRASTALERHATSRCTRGLMVRCGKNIRAHSGRDKATSTKNAHGSVPKTKGFERRV